MVASAAAAITTMPPAAETVARASGTRGPVRIMRPTTTVLATRYDTYALDPISPAVPTSRLEAGPHVRQQQPVAVPGQAEGHRDHADAGRHQQPVHETSLAGDVWPSGQAPAPRRKPRGRTSGRRSSQWRGRRSVPTPPWRGAVPASGARPASTEPARGRGHVRARPAPVGPDAALRGELPAPGYVRRRRPARDQTVGNQPLDQPGPSRVGHAKDVGEPPDTAAGVGQQCDQGGVFGRRPSAIIRSARARACTPSRFSRRAMPPAYI